jgi:hypothetical protein
MDSVNPETTLQLTRTYITLILLHVYGLELILPNRTQTTKLEIFQNKLLEQLLSLPQNAPDSLYIC